MRAAMISSYDAPFSKLTVRSTTETSTVGTLQAGKMLRQQSPSCHGREEGFKLETLLQAAKSAARPPWNPPAAKQSSGRGCKQHTTASVQSLKCQCLMKDTPFSRLTVRSTTDTSTVGTLQPGTLLRQLPLVRAEG